MCGVGAYHSEMQAGQTASMQKLAERMITHTTQLPQVKSGLIGSFVCKTTAKQSLACGVQTRLPVRLDFGKADGWPKASFCL